MSTTAGDKFRESLGSSLGTHLWEAQHEYYCEEGNFYHNGCCTRYDMWADFIFDMGDADMDYNLLFRWDWRPDGEGREVDDQYEYHASIDSGQRGYVLQLSWMAQRKGRYFSSLVKVCRDDEESVLAYLAPRHAYMVNLWGPMGQARSAYERIVEDSIVAFGAGEGQPDPISGRQFTR